MHACAGLRDIDSSIQEPAPLHESVTSHEEDAEDLAENVHTDDTLNDDNPDKPWDIREYLFPMDIDSQTEEMVDDHDKTGGMDDNSSNNSTDPTVFDEYVFPGCPLQTNISSVRIMAYIFCHKLSQSAAEDLIELLTAHFPDDHKAMTSLYRLKLHWKKKCKKINYVKALVCSSCESLVEKDDSQCQ
jgi:hypothetical protein